MKAVFLLSSALLLAPLYVSAGLPVAKEEIPLVYHIVSVQIAGGAPDERATVMFEQQTGRSWMLVQRGSGSPVWQALTFDAGFTLNQQTLPPDLGRLQERRERSGDR